MRWIRSHRADPLALRVANSHYSRQKPWTNQFVPPGRCAVFRIAEAVAATRTVWEPPPLGIVTFVDASKTRKKRDPGRCYRRAGWVHVGFTKGGLWAFQQKPEDMPPAEEPVVIDAWSFWR